MTESGAMATTNYLGKKSGSVGKAHPGLEIMISNPDPVTNDGEVW